MIEKDLGKKCHLLPIYLGKKYSDKRGLSRTFSKLKFQLIRYTIETCELNSYVLASQIAKRDIQSTTEPCQVF